MDRTRSALGIIAAATAVALIVYGVIRALWLQPVGEQFGTEKPIGWLSVLISTVVAGLLAWGVATVLERAGRARWWPFIGSTALAISMIAPTSLAGGSSMVALIILHFAVAIVLITGFAGLILSGYGPDRTRELGHPSTGNR